MFKGSFVALVTPFKNGKIDNKKLEELVEWHISEGTNGLVPIGTTGESSTLSHEEDRHVIEIVVRAAKKRVPVIAGAGSNSTKEAVSMTQEAKKLGADAVLSVNPYYNRPTQEGLKAHFSAIALAADIPVILYNIPSRTAVHLAPETIAELAEKHSNICGVKEASGSMDQVTAILNKTRENFCVFSGDDSLTLPMMAVGAGGVISVTGNLIPKTIRDLCHFALAGDFEKARALHKKIFPLFKALFLETSPAPIKAAMFEAGLLDEDSLRLPLVPVLPETREKIKAAMREAGVQIPVSLKGSL